MWSLPISKAAAYILLINTLGRVERHCLVFAVVGTPAGVVHAGAFIEESSSQLASSVDSEGFEGFGLGPE